MNLPLPQDIDWRLRVFDSLSFPTLILEPNRTILSVNQKLLEKYGLAREEIVGNTCREFFQTFEWRSGSPLLQKFLSLG